MTWSKCCNWDIMYLGTDCDSWFGASETGLILVCWILQCSEDRASNPPISSEHTTYTAELPCLQGRES